MGVTLGILFAPASGSKTRALIGDKAKKVSDSVTKNYKKVKNFVNKSKKEDALNTPIG